MLRSALDSVSVPVFASLSTICSSCCVCRSCCAVLQELILLERKDARSLVDLAVAPAVDVVLQSVGDGSKALKPEPGQFAPGAGGEGAASCVRTKRPRAA